MSSFSSAYNRDARRERHAYRLTASSFLSALTIALYCGVVGFVVYATVHGLGEESAGAVYLGR